MNTNTSTSTAPPPRLRWAWPLGLALVAAVVPFWHVWASVYRVVAREDSFGYAALIPVAAAFLAWQRRHRLRSLRLHGRGWGVALAAAGVGVYFLAQAVGSEMLWYIGPLLVLYGAVVAALGVGVIIPFAAVFGVLLLVVPPPGEVVTWIAFKLMFISATITTDVLRATGFDVQQFNNLIVVNGHEVNVAAACSGIRSLFALGAVIGVFAFALPFKWWVRFGMIAIAPAMALLGNLTRLIPTAIMHGVSSEAVAGVTHDLLGIAAFAAIMFAYLALLGAIRWAGVNVFRPRPRPREYAAATSANPSDEQTTSGGAQPRAWPVLGVVVLLLVVTPVIAQGWPRSHGEDAYHARVAAAISGAHFALPGMTARDSVLDVGAVNLLRPNASRCVTITDPATGRALQVSLIHCRYVRDLMNHFPPVCYPNAGWSLVRATPIPLPAGDADIPATEYHFRRTTRESIQELFVVNFFITPDGRFTATQDEAIGTSLQKGQRDAWGLAQCSFVYSPLVGPDRRRTWSGELVAENRAAFEAIRMADVDGN